MHLQINRTAIEDVARMRGGVSETCQAQFDNMLEAEKNDLRSWLAQIDTRRSTDIYLCIDDADYVQDLADQVGCEPPHLIEYAKLHALMGDPNATRITREHLAVAVRIVNQAKRAEH